MAENSKSQSSLNKT